MSRPQKLRCGIAGCMIGIIVLAVAIFFSHPLIAQPGRSRSTDDGFGNSGASGNVRIALAWGQHFEPPQSLSNTAIRLADAVNRWTDVQASAGRNVTLGDSNLLNYRFVIVATEKAFELTETERKNVRAFFDNGGFMYLDHPDTRSTNSGSSLRKLVRDTIPNARFESLRASDRIYNTVFDFSGGPPPGIALDKKDDNQYYLEGVRYKGRIVAVYCNRGYVTKWIQDSNNEPELRMGVNMVVYTLTQ